MGPGDAKIHIFNDLTVVLLLVYLLLGRKEVSVVKVLASKYNLQLMINAHNLCYLYFAKAERECF
jgi:hypothetical protein